MQWTRVGAVRRTSFGGWTCSIAQALEVVGEWWSLLIVRDAFKGVRRFEDFQRGLGIARNVLAERLQGLVAEGVFERRLSGPARPLRVPASPRRASIYPIIVGLMRWGDKWAPSPDGPR